MNKADAQGIVYRLTARSLRAMSRRQKDWPKYPEIGRKPSEAEAAKLVKEMLALADKLEDKFPERAPIDTTGEVVNDDGPGIPS